MPWKNFDYVHYLNNHELQKSQLLQPIFEAVQNAFQSVDDRNSGGAYVEVVIDRDDTQATIDFPEVGDRIGSAPDVSTVQIVDLGLGFTDSNWDAFETISTSHRKEHGGKGMGRLLYCVPFRKVEFDSVYDDDGKLRRRTFDLSRRIKGTSRPKVTDAATDDESKTSVTFVKPTAELKSVFPKSAHALARKFVKHFFKRLSMEKDGRFFVTDKWSGERVDVVQLCHDEFILEQSTEDVRILKRQYQLTHVRLRRNVGKRHEVLLCGQGRLVRTLDLGPALVWLRRAISHADGAFYYAGFLEGKVLDGALQEERLSFNLPENLETDDDEFEFGEDPNKPSIDRLVNDVAKHAKTFLRDYVSKIEDAHWKRIQEFCGKNPVFRPLLSHKKADLLAVPEHLPDEPFAEAIGAIYHRWKTETKQRFKALSASVRANKSAQDQYMASYRDALKELNELAFYELAEYVVDRKAVIDFLWDRMKQAESGKFFDEDAVHDIFFPRKATTSDIDWDESQLWLIDERLMLQSFVASDLPLNQHQTLDTREVDRPDLAVYHDTAFDAAYAFGEGPRTTFTAVTIVEFKRPGRDNYGEDENPIRQVIKYIRKIRAAKAKQVDGHVLRICDASPIHVYVVCHIVDSLLEHMGEYQYVQTQDGQGILMHAPKLNAFIQVITFEKLIEDARTRHESFFRKLGLPEF